MNLLEEKIIRKIKENGPITFKQFMTDCLYDSEYGYYTSQNKIFGREGDFYTAAHLHPVLGSIIGKQIKEMWQIMDRPSNFTIVEMGAGTGMLCKDILDYLKFSDNRNHEAGETDDFYRILDYIIIEINPNARGQQVLLLHEHFNKITWHSDLRDIDQITGCIFSNELLDAFPVHMIKVMNGIKEIFVDFDGRRFIERDMPVSTEKIFEYVEQFAGEMEEGYRTEINLNIKNWLQDIYAILQEGFIFTIDYGYTASEYYSEDRNRGTLMCYYKHTYHEDPYQHIGQQDITSHVNFSSLKKWGDDIGIKTIGYCNQGAFLVSAGIDEEIRRLMETSKNYLFELANIKKLIMPQGMGDIYKVMLQYKGNNNPILKGFQLSNRIRTL